MVAKQFQSLFSELMDFRENMFLPPVWILGDPEIGENVYVSGFSELNAKGARVVIGGNCDIASFVSIDCADSHHRFIGLSDDVDRRDITPENNVFVGSHSVIKGGSSIGHRSVVAAGTIVERGYVPPYSLVVGNPLQVMPGYYLDAKHEP